MQSRGDTDLYTHITEETEDAASLHSPCSLEHRLKVKDRNRYYILNAYPRHCSLHPVTQGLNIFKFRSALRIFLI